MADELGLEAQKIDEHIFVFHPGADYEEIFTVVTDCLGDYEVIEDEVDNEYFELQAKKERNTYKIRIDYNAEETRVFAQKTERQR